MVNKRPGHTVEEVTVIKRKKTTHGKQKKSSSGGASHDALIAAIDSVAGGMAPKSPPKRNAAAKKKSKKKSSKKSSSKKSSNRVKPKDVVKKVEQVRKSLKTTQTRRANKKSGLTTPTDIAMDFAAEVHKRFENIVKASILFGSQAKDTANTDSDIDIILIVDDAAIEWDMELVAWYREELAKLIALSTYRKDLHVNTVKLSTWWDDLMHGDPVVINILRYGRALIDIGGFFNPLKALLLKGKIHATPEAVYAALQRAPYHLARSEHAQRMAIEGVYWTMVDSAQAALITLGKLPPSPEHIPAMMRDLFVPQNMISKEMVEWFTLAFQLHKAVDRGHAVSLKGQEIDMWQDRAGQFMQRMTEIIDQLLQQSQGSSESDA